MRTSALVIVLLPFTGSAQFVGGNGRGDAAQLHLPTPVVSSIYHGANGRGDAAQTHLPAPLSTSIFNGGNGRGDVAQLYLPTPMATTLFNGGNGRGDVAQIHLPASLSTSIYSGGSGRGDVSQIHLPVPLLTTIFSGGVGRGDVAVLFNTSQVLLALKSMLEGPYSSTTGLMSDALRSASLLPATEPYTGLGYTHVGGGGETVAPSVLTVTGTNAIVDWVVVELRDATTPTAVLATRCALIQCDGDIVSVDGVSPVTFSLPSANYKVSLRHRNHLGAMTLNAVALSGTVAPVDLSSAGTAAFGTDARKPITGTFPTQALWAGDVTFNHQIKYTGSGNDRDPILVTVGSTTPNNVVSNAYSTRDVNLNGQVKYTGSGNDRDPILVNVGSTTPNNVRVEQLP